MSADLLAHCTRVLFDEAACLDQHRWADWLALYAADAEYWLPAWTDDGRPTNDPRTELSLIYYNSKSGLEDRVWRIESGLSPASQPLDRTCHLITNVRLTSEDADQPAVAAHWQVNMYKPEKQQSFLYYGFYEHGLRRTQEGYQIAKKKIILLNDVVEGVLDIYHI